MTDIRMRPSISYSFSTALEYHSIQVIVTWKKIIFTTHPRCLTNERQQPQETSLSWHKSRAQHWKNTSNSIQNSSTGISLMIAGELHHQSHDEMRNGQSESRAFVQTTMHSERIFLVTSWATSIFHSGTNKDLFPKNISLWYKPLISALAMLCRVTKEEQQEEKSKHTHNTDFSKAIFKRWFTFLERSDERNSDSRHFDERFSQENQNRSRKLRHCGKLENATNFRYRNMQHFENMGKQVLRSGHVSLYRTSLCVNQKF